MPEIPSDIQQPGASDWLVGGGKMGQVIRSMDWSQTPLGSIDSWSPSLRTIVSLVINSNFPISLAWGQEYTQIYNDGYWPICGDKHPLSMGQNFTECWASAFPVIGAAFRSALAGTTAFLEDQRMFLDRRGYLEETFFTFSFSPIRDEHSQVVGLFHPVTETTSKLLGQRRTYTLRDIAAHGSSAYSLDHGLQLVAQTLAESTLDLPFVLFYTIDSAGRTAQLAAQAGLVPGSAACPETIDLMFPAIGWPLASVAADGRTMQINDLPERFPDLICGPYPEPIRSAFIQAISPPGHAHPVCIMVAGVSTRLPINETYVLFYDLLAASVTTVIANAIARQTERQRTEALAEIDRLKTAFFNNVSHEFRTPLTLLLGPLEDELAEYADTMPTVRRQRLEMAHRNSLRLLKLVNTLLDFARIEAGRVQAVYQPTDLAALTIDLAGNFRSACEQAGLQLIVDCAALPAAVYVDHNMWEKIVLNLLSNAFKFTLAGTIIVRIIHTGAEVQLVVSDTGVGISPPDLAHIFDRFHRVKGTQGRTHEGTGIGLALVQELTTLHGGTIHVESVVGLGSTFTIMLPYGMAHLPAEQIGAERGIESTALGISPFVEEALRWLPGPTMVDQQSALQPVAAQDTDQWPLVDHFSSASATSSRARIVWADDNADMRDYVQRLLSVRYDVETVSDGMLALAAIRRQPADLILSDIMMPHLDGFGLLRELRNDQRTRNIPIILLSARAGEEARIEGLNAGADDYLIKPFNARELLARISAQVELGRLRRTWEIELEQQVAQRTAALVQLTSDLQVEMAEHRRSELALRRSEQQYHLLFDTMLQGTVYQDRNGQIIAMNLAAERILGRTMDELAGHTSKDLEHTTLREDGSQFPGAEHPSMVALHTGMVVPGVTMRIFNPREQNYRWINISAVPLFNHDSQVAYQVYTIFEDITERKQAEQALQRYAHRLRVLADASHAFAEAGTDYHRLLNRVAQTSAIVLGEGCAIRLLSEDKLHLPLVALYDVDPKKRELADLLMNEAILGTDQPSFTNHVFRSGQPILIPVLDQQRIRATLDPAQWPLIERLGSHSLVVVPMRVQGQIIGVMVLSRHRPEQPPFDQDDLSLAQDLADRAAMAITNMRLLAQVQRELAERTRAEAEVRMLSSNLEQRVIERTAELMAANKELEAFSYSISHDLRAPLRAIDGFSRILVEEYAAELPKEAQHYFQVVRDNAQQMGHLVDDLLGFSRLSRQPLSRRLVDPTAVVRQCLEELHAEQLGRTISIKIGDLPTCLADSALLKQVWINLIANALKYTRRCDAAQIEIGCQVHAATTIYMIKDNGVGFDMNYSSKLFGVFQRMHRAEDYEGTGVGLAIVQRIVQRHGGRIWAEAAIDQGATFYFTLGEDLAGHLATIQK